MTSLMHLTAACFFSLYWLTLCICDGARVDDDVTGDGGRTRAAGIVNGHDSPDRPFYVRVRPHQPGRKGTCGGCVISRHLVLTAAHCVGELVVHTHALAHSSLHQLNQHLNPEGVFLSRGSTSRRGGRTPKQKRRNSSEK